jgi:hypothetical protein
MIADAQDMGYLHHTSITTINSISINSPMPFLRSQTYTIMCLANNSLRNIWDTVHKPHRFHCLFPSLPSRLCHIVRHSETYLQNKPLAHGAHSIKQTWVGDDDFAGILVGCGGSWPTNLADRLNSATFGQRERDCVMWGSDRHLGT